ncbi:wall-associated receptor kinase 5-like isoform X2 [Magnolia sinica]|uniref:wall-associated receptor kinase 5-like isoform X2 n=1 Tax=Magnolia sinica TaxID=86752 RepID=UPI0026580D8B|nr:wall-associated receptor kinase 5-like isoform X2 [Magnolia sinica]
MSSMVTLFCCFIFLSLTHLSSTNARAIDSTSIADCPRKCGDIDISYPFGIGYSHCFYKGFEINCSQNIPYLSGYLMESRLQLVEILQEEVRINWTDFIVKICPSSNYTKSSIFWLSEESPFVVPAATNKFIVIGCNTTGMVTAMDKLLSYNGCYSECPTKESIVNGSCKGQGCCEAGLPQLRKMVLVSLHSSKSSISACSYGFFIEDGRYTFKESDLLDFDKTARISMRLEWSIRGSCGEPSNACGSNASCSNTNYGYRCNCSDGYRGNPYLYGSQGCQGAKCRNTVPGFVCECPTGTKGDGRTGGNGCSRAREIIPISMVLIGTLLCTIALCLVGCFWVRRKTNLANVRAKYFRMNGGILLQQQLSYLHGSTRSPKIYSARELKKATNNYHISNILGSGGNGSIFKGILKDGSIVAIKKSQVADKSHIDQFINEVVILTEINHRNVVKLLGCCLETQVPMLVYEYISNGTLYQKIHENDNPSDRVSWKSRFRIAIDTAGALSYLHSSTSTPIFHRDIKSSNILLDKNYTPKVADFGISRLVPLDKTKVSTMVLGTYGYLDPEYFNTGKLTEKSDVYSFGVVLLELLTGRKPICPDSSVEYHNLPMVFLSYVRNDNFIEILDEKVVREVKMEELQAVADIATRCLLVKGDERPTMKEVVQELIALSGEHVQLGRECEAHEW